MSASEQPIVHTPGPWKAVALPTDSKRLTNEECDIVEVNATGPEGKYYKICTVYYDRDRRLIEAAPDLLKALELLWTEVSESGNATANDFGWKRAREATLAALRKVV